MNYWWYRRSFVTPFRLPDSHVSKIARWWRVASAICAKSYRLACISAQRELSCECSTWCGQRLQNLMWSAIFFASVADFAFSSGGGDFLLLKCLSKVRPFAMQSADGEFLFLDADASWLFARSKGVPCQKTFFSDFICFTYRQPLNLYIKLLAEG